MYREIPVSLVSMEQEFDFSIYLKIQDSYRLFAARGAKLTRDHVGILRARDTHVFVRDDEWENAREAMARRRRRDLTNPRLNTRQKADLIYTDAMDSIKDAYHGLVPKTIADVEKSAEELVKVILADEHVIDSLKLIETKDHFTYQHSVRVGIYSTALMLKIMGERLTRTQIKKLSTGFFLHDIGMTRIPLQILEKPEKLSDFEWKLIRMHPIWGHDNLIKTEYLSLEATNIILSHHERNDGTGYPHKRKGEDIPVYARICTIADAYESLTAQRPYRKPMEPFDALRVMHQEMSREFDGEVFIAFVKLLGPKA